MLSWIWIVPIAPLLGFLFLSLAGERVSRRTVAMAGTGSVGLSAVIAVLVAYQFMTGHLRGGSFAFDQVWWTWCRIAELRVPIGVHLDAVSTVMMVVVTFVACVIHLFSIEFMQEEEGYGRFFAYMNLFVGSMLILVLADTFLLLLLGWEGVGLCSYLLIGFWYRDSENCHAAQKAFLMTRLADIALIIGILMIFSKLGTLNIQDALEVMAVEWPMGSGAAMTVAALFLVGAIGKSAQIPLQAWLPDAMAGPTPVSALIHAATMVTAGVYLIARMHELFELAPMVQMMVGLIGGVTLILTAFSALVQQDAKRILAYSTMSQLGYMFLALGVGAVSAALFHFMTHAFIKALLFLAVGAITLHVSHERNIMNMGGLRRDLPVAFWTFLIGAASLSGVPLTAGFFSKDQILWEVWSQPLGSTWLWGIAVLGVFVTALYSFRAVFFMFFGEQTTRPTTTPDGWIITGPLVLLAGCSLLVGWVDWPRTFGNLSLFRDFIHTAVPVHRPTPHLLAEEFMVQLAGTAIALLGILVAYVLFLRHPRLVQSVIKTDTGDELRRMALRGWGFNRLYDWMFVQPFLKTVRASKDDVFDRLYARFVVESYLWVAAVNKDDLLDRVYENLVKGNRACHVALRRVHTGRLHWYVQVLGLGAVVMVGLVVLL